MHERTKNHNSLAYNLTYGDDRVICMSSIVADDALVGTIAVDDGNNWGIVGSDSDNAKGLSLNISLIFAR